METQLRIAGYTVHRLIGQGGMAAVYLATQESLNRQVAIKVLANFTEQHAKERFFSEAKIIAALNHPNIVTIYDVAHLEDGRPYISMEYFGGGDLNRLKGQTFNSHYALNLVRQIAQGLQAVHQKNIIHRDIKPANILFREDGSVVLSDFGIAKHLAQDSDLTQAGLSLGSPSYSSPEQIRGEQLDSRSDIYSLGVVLLELLSGKNVFKGASYTETALNHIENPAPDLSSIPPECRALLEKMLARSLKDRYASVAELLADMNHTPLPLIDREAHTTLSPSFKAHQHWAERLRNYFSQRLRALSITVAVVALGAVMLSALYETESERQIKSLLDKAEASIRAQQLIEPEFNNARYFYNQVLAIAPDNDDALEGLEEVNELLVDHYVELATQRLEQNRLYTPANDNAIFYYRQALSIDPESRSARKGIERAAENCVILAREAFNKNDYRQGLKLVTIGLEIAPENEDLLELHEQYKNKGNPVKRLVERFFDNGK